MKASRILVVALALASLPACMTNAPVPESTASSMPTVSSVQLSETVGEVGQKFEAQVALHTRRMGDTEVRVKSLPPGLRFDEESMTIRGVPQADGFFAVTVAVRKKQGKGVHFLTPAGAWHSERLSIDIYKPVEDGGEPDRWGEYEADLAANGQ